MIGHSGNHGRTVFYFEFFQCVWGGGGVDDITCMLLYVAAIGKSQTLLFGSHPPCFLRQDPPLAKQSRPAD